MARVGFFFFFLWFCLGVSAHIGLFEKQTLSTSAVLGTSGKSTWHEMLHPEPQILKLKYIADETINLYFLPDF